MEWFLNYAQQVGAMATRSRAQMDSRVIMALEALAGRQPWYQQERDPVARFLAGLRLALKEGRAHVADRTGKPPLDAGAWGWQPTGTRKTWARLGICIGWVQDDDLYLDPGASYQLVQELGGMSRLQLSEQALWRRLRETGMLASTDAARQMLRVRRILAGVPRQVLHLRSNALRGHQA